MSSHRSAPPSRGRSKVVVAAADVAAASPPGDVGAMPAHRADVNQYLAAYIMGLANRLSNGASQHYRRHFNLGMSEWRAMMAIGTSKDRIVRQVAEMADLDYAAASKSLKVLQQRGLVAVEQTNRRGRAALASLTPEGLDLYRQIRGEALRRQKRLVAEFTPQQLEQLWSLLRVVEARIPAMNADG